MLAAFLAGFFTVGAAILMPGGGTRTDTDSPVPEDPPAAHLPSGDNAQSGPASRTSPRDRFPGARLAIVVFDSGYDPTRDAEWLKFPEKITIAVIPFGPSSRRLAKSAHERGFGLLIHAPMEPEGSASDRTDAFRFRRGMSAGEMEALLDRMIKENPWATGVSNHMGSAFTADPGSMAAFAAVLKSRGLYFLDSMTTPRSVAVATGRKAGIPVAKRDVLFDGGMKPDELRLQWKRTLSIARERGTAILVCHGRKESLRAILDLLPDLEAEGVRAVTLRELLTGEGAG